MPQTKISLLILIAFLASYLFSKTVERSLKYRGLPSKKVFIYKNLAFVLMFITLSIVALI
jgi:hypothetical protein